jgi:hypothetical protein
MTELHCVDWPFQVDALRRLKPSRQLRALSLSILPDELEASLTVLARHSELRHLRINNPSATPTTLAINSLLSLSYLTTLSLWAYEPDLRTAALPSMNMESLHFPCLRVLTLQNLLSIKPQELFIFIAEHSGLSQVNVTFTSMTSRSSTYVLLYPLIKLIMGEGVWDYAGLDRLQNPYPIFVDPEFNLPRGRNNEHSTTELDYADILPSVIPSDALSRSFCSIKIRGFGFERKRVASHDCPVGYRLPCYTVSALSLVCAEDEENVRYLNFVAIGISLIHLTKALYAFDLSGRCPCLASFVESFSVDSDWIPPGGDFATAMVSIDADFLHVLWL